MTRVFISSVIRGFEEYRSAARKAVGLVGFDAVMAEDFPAQSRSSQAACSDGVRSSDIYVGIIGPQYGPRTDKGVSATEEEFDEASKRPMTKLLFKTRAALDQDQSTFVERIAGKWSDGLFYCRFETPEELKDEIVKALSAVRTGTQAVPEGVASEELHSLLSSFNPRYEEVILSIASVPAHATEPVLGLHEIDAAGDSVAAIANRLPKFSSGQAKVLCRERSVRVFDTLDGRAEIAQLEFFDDGRIVSHLGQRVPGRADLAASYIIDLLRLREDAIHLLEMFSAVYTLDRRRIVTQLFVQGQLRGIRHRMVATLPKEPVNSITVPMHDLPDPLAFPSSPMKLAIESLRDPTTAGAMVGALERRFRDALSGRH